VSYRHSYMLLAGILRR